jgi:hypothetical protein
MSISSRTFIQCLVSRFTCFSSSNNEYGIFKRRKKWRPSKYTSFEHLPNELLLEILEYFTLLDIYTIFYGLNSRLNQLIVFSCIRGFVIHSTKENNLYLKHILPDIPPWQINTLTLWHNSSYEQLLNHFPINLYRVHTLKLQRLKNLSFHQCRHLLKHFQRLETLSMVDFNTGELDWLDDNKWKNLIEIDLPCLRHLYVRICVIYHKQIYDDDKDNIIYSFTSRYARPTYRLYTGSLLKRNPILEICLTIDQAFPLR